MTFKLAFILDEIFKGILIFFISIVFFRAIRISFRLCLLFSALTTIFICILLFMLKTKRDDKKHIKVAELSKIAKIKEQFSFASKIEILNYLKTLFNAEINYKKELTLDDGKTILIPFYNKDTFELTDLKELYRENKNRRVTKVKILCFAYTEECKLLSQNFKKIEYEIIDFNELYTKYVKPQNLEPQFIIEKLPKEKMTFNRFKCYAFNKSKTKTYFLCGIILLFSSYFVPLRIYYLIFSGLMFISTLLCITLNIKRESK